MFSDEFCGHVPCLERLSPCFGTFLAIVGIVLRNCLLVFIFGGERTSSSAHSVPTDIHFYDLRQKITVFIPE